MPVKLIFLTIHCDSALLSRAMELAPKGYILKDSFMGEIVEGIRRVSRGQFYASPAITGQLFEQRYRSSRAVCKPALASLTPVERDVITSDQGVLDMRRGRLGAAHQPA